MTKDLFIRFLSVGFYRIIDIELFYLFRREWICVLIKAHLYVIYSKMSPLPQEEPDSNLEEVANEVPPTTATETTQLLQKTILDEANEKYPLHHFDHKLHVQEKLHHHTESSIFEPTAAGEAGNFLQQIILNKITIVLHFL